MCYEIGKQIAGRPVALPSEGRAIEPRTGISAQHVPGADEPAIFFGEQSRKLTDNKKTRGPKKTGSARLARAAGGLGATAYSEGRRNAMALGAPGLQTARLHKVVSIWRLCGRCFMRPVAASSARL